MIERPSSNARPFGSSRDRACREPVSRPGKPSRYAVSTGSTATRSERRTPRGRLGVALALALAGCGKGPAPDALDTDQQIVRQVLTTLASDGKPVCVSRWTFGSPLSQFRVTKRGELQRYYVLDWAVPGPWRPPHMPTQKELREAVRHGRDANIPEPSGEIAVLPEGKRRILDGLAFAIAPPAVTLHAVLMHQRWMPKGVVARWWMGRDEKLGCEANYVLSGIKRTEHAAFVAVRVHHWGTLYALVGGVGKWHVVGQWGPWLY